MPLSPNQVELIKQLELATLVGGRYEKLRCVNASGTARRGVLSLVFQGYDRVNDCLVAMKFMDPDRLSDAYRIAAFEREPEILELVEGRKRCLQIADNLQHYDWEVTLPGAASPLKFRCAYFVTEWIEEDIDDYFFQQDTIDPAEKLRIFRDLVLSIEAIHSANICHRDLKIDNVRLKVVENEQIVVTIDFGTAAHHDTPSLSSAYARPVGASAFAPPEAFVGFSGDRKLGHLADSYALGALLFDLFNTREFRFVRGSETPFNSLLAAVGSSMAASASRDDSLKIWRNHVRQFRAQSNPPQIDGAGNSIPPSIKSLVNRVYLQLANFDFNRRTSNFSAVRNVIDSALRALANTKKQAEELKRKRRMRKQRQDKALLKQQKLDHYLTNRLGHDA
ncbi:MAG: protein kinase [Proteobacteria bacterium]|nr:protein kinase [Pseudomonadota bacterium]